MLIIIIQFVGNVFNQQLSTQQFSTQQSTFGQPLNHMLNTQLNMTPGGVGQVMPNHPHQLGQSSLVNSSMQPQMVCK